MDNVTMPTIYISHGGGPCFWIDFPPPIDPRTLTRLADYLGGIVSRLPNRPRAILVVTAHWEAAVPTFATNPHPGMLYDYYGFPKHTYELQFPAPGAPELAMHARALLREAGIESADDPRRGFDHGVFVPMLKVLPDADIPVLEMSICADMDSARHIAIGRALAPLREEGVLIIGSGFSYHNMRGFFADSGSPAAIWDEWLIEAATDAEPAQRDRKLSNWARAPHARDAHPKEEHLIPLMVVAGAAGSDVGRHAYADTFGNKRFSGFEFG